MSESNLIQPSPVQAFNPTDGSRKSVNQAEVIPEKSVNNQGAKAGKPIPDQGHNGNVQALDDKLTNINGLLEKSGSYLRFERDDASERMLIRIRDQQTSEVIRQIPSEQFLDVSENISQFLERRHQDPLNYSEPILPGLLANVTV